MLRLVATLVAALSTGLAVAGEAYSPPTVAGAGRVEPPADLLADIEVLRTAISARDVQAVAPFIGGTVTILNGAIDMHVKRRSDPLGPFEDARAALIELGQNTGGDWYVPEGADVGEVLVEQALQFWGRMLEDADWGLDPLAPGAICTYEAQLFDPDEVARIGAQLDVSSASFVMVETVTLAMKLPGPRAAVGAFEPGKLYALDYDTDTPDGGMAVHMPEGGEGFLAFGEGGMLKPHMVGLCFAAGENGLWQVVAQTNTTL
jgi:hypothetical protein